MIPQSRSLLGLLLRLPRQIHYQTFLCKVLMLVRARIKLSLLGCMGQPRMELPAFVKSDIAVTGTASEEPASAGVAAGNATGIPAQEVDVAGLPSFVRPATIKENVELDSSMTRFEKAVAVTVPAFPKINGLDAWRTAVCRGLAAAAGQYDQAEVARFAEVYTKTDEELGESVSARRFWDSRTTISHGFAEDPPTPRTD